MDDADLDPRPAQLERAWEDCQDDLDPEEQFPDFELQRAIDTVVSLKLSIDRIVKPAILDAYARFEDVCDELERGGYIIDGRMHGPAQMYERMWWAFKQMSVMYDIQKDTMSVVGQWYAPPPLIPAWAVHVIERLDQPGYFPTGVRVVRGTGPSREEAG